MLSQSVLARPLPPVKQQAEREAAQPQLSLAVGETFQHLLNFVSQRDLLAWLADWLGFTNITTTANCTVGSHVCKFGKFEIDKYQNKVQIN